VAAVDVSRQSEFHAHKQTPSMDTGGAGHQSGDRRRAYRRRRQELGRLAEGGSNLDQLAGAGAAVELAGAVPGSAEAGALRRGLVVLNGGQRARSSAS
jgi:hypothetical protein